MTYGENKKIFFSLIDEYAPNTEFFTEDEDARTKCANLYAPAYQELADFRTRRKLKTLDVSKGEGYEEFNLPKAQEIRQVLGTDEYNNRKSVDWWTAGEKIFINRKEDAKVMIEYVPYLSVITDDTEDEFELEIDQDLQMILPYKVASDLFKTDPGEDWTAFEKEYQRRLQSIKTSKWGLSANVTEGEF